MLADFAADFGEIGKCNEFDKILPNSPNYLTYAITLGIPKTEIGILKLRFPARAPCNAALIFQNIQKLRILQILCFISFI